MRRLTMTWLAGLPIAVALLVVASVALAWDVSTACGGQAQALHAGYSISRWTVQGGGGSTGGDGYRLMGTAGQSDAGVLGGGGYILGGGFWGGTARLRAIYLPLVLRSSP